VYKGYKILKIESELFKNKIDIYSTKQTLVQDETKQDNKKSIDEGNEILNHSDSHLEELKTKIQKDTIENENAMLNNWSVEVQLYCILKIYLTYGVLRPSEIVNCLICDCDGDNTTNYINVTKNRL